MTPITSADTSSLRRGNLIVGGLHAAQAVVLLLVASSATLPVNASYLTGPPGSGDFGGPANLFDLRIDIAIAVFLGLAAVDHLAVAGPARGWYERNVARGINPARWWEYSLSASLMIVLIAMLSGISEATALVAIFGVNAAMILFGLAMERVNVDRAEPDWRPFIYGNVAGVVPWLAITLQLVVAESEGGGAPGFVYAIFFSLLVLFSSFAVNMWLQYRRVGRWKDPVFAEKAYLVLSLVSKSVLAWQVYAGALAGS